MKRGHILVVGVLIAIIVFAYSVRAIATMTPTPSATRITISAVTKYDPTRDPAQDLRVALKEAQQTNKRILLEVGGDWCIWCLYMDQFFEGHPDSLNARTEKYILIKVNFSQENKNKSFLSQYPEIPGYPHIFILDSAGRLVHSQNTLELEQGESYNPQKFLAFLERWAAK